MITLLSMPRKETEVIPRVRMDEVVLRAVPPDLEDCRCECRKHRSHGACGEKTGLEPATARPPSPAAGTQLDELIESGREVFELFRDAQGRAYARTLNVGARDAVRLPSREARHVLQRAYRDEHGRSPRPQAVTESMDALAAEAVHEGDRHAVFVRTGHSKDGFVLDLAVEAPREGSRVPPLGPRRLAGTVIEPTDGVPTASQRELVRAWHAEVRAVDAAVHVADLGVPLRS